MAKQPKGIPISALIKSRGFQRNYEIEFKKALDAELLSNAVVGIKHKDGQREKARQPRNKMREVIAAESKQRPDLSPLELLPHVNSAADANGMKPISLKRLKDVLRERPGK